jgi:hypothetical protein
VDIAMMITPRVKKFVGSSGGVDSGVCMTVPFYKQ